MDAFAFWPQNFRRWQGPTMILLLLYECSGALAVKKIGILALIGSGNVKLWTRVLAPLRSRPTDHPVEYLLPNIFPSGTL